MILNAARGVFHGYLGGLCFVVGFGAFWAFLSYFGSMRKELLRVSPLRTKGLRNLFDANNVELIWDKHRQHFRQSRLRKKAKAAACVAAVFFAVAFVLQLLRI